MAVSERTRDWFEKEYGYSLGDAYEVQKFMSERDSSGRIGGARIDAENEALADKIDIYVPRRDSCL